MNKTHLRGLSPEKMEHDEPACHTVIMVRGTFVKFKLTDDEDKVTCRNCLIYVNHRIAAREALP